MRTKDQIANLRRAMAVSGMGAFVNILDDERINQMADTLQRRIDSLSSEKYRWSVTIKLFTENNPEPPIFITEGFENLDTSYRKMMEKYHEIEEIRLHNLDDDSVYLLKRKAPRK